MNRMDAKMEQMLALLHQLTAQVQGASQVQGTLQHTA